jgi:hypothetical protein
MSGIVSKRKIEQTLLLFIVSERCLLDFLDGIFYLFFGGGVHCEGS